jgi:hypothetical protein
MGRDGLCARPRPALAVGSAMPRDGSVTLSDLEGPFLRIVCEPCGRRGRYAVARPRSTATRRAKLFYRPTMLLICGRLEDQS